LASGAAVVVCVVLLAAQDGWHDRLWLELVPGVLTFAAPVCGLAGFAAGRWGSSNIASAGYLLVAFVFTVATIPLTAGATVLVPFEPVRLCVAGYDVPRDGRLIALTTNWAVVGRHDEGSPSRHSPDRGDPARQERDPCGHGWHQRFCRHAPGRRRPPHRNPGVASSPVCKCERCALQGSADGETGLEPRTPRFSVVWRCL
jgi:hypothetical protein